MPTSENNVTTKIPPLLLMLLWVSPPIWAYSSKHPYLMYDLFGFVSIYTLTIYDLGGWVPILTGAVSYKMSFPAFKSIKIVIAQAVGGAFLMGWQSNASLMNIIPIITSTAMLYLAIIAIFVTINALRHRNIS